VDLGFTPEQAQAEAKRCLQCAVCCECRACEEACAEIGAIDHFRAARRLRLEAPAVIVADESELPALDEDVRAGLMTVGSLSYGPDLLNVLMAGTVAAGRAMASAARLRPSAELEEPEYEQSAKGRLGFFLCACNQTMAPPAVLQAILAQAGRAPEVAHAQMVTSVCQGSGADQIAKAVKRQGLSRVILASCVCCPLNFHCISCNDQRTRARNHLFERLGLKRCSFETINLRDHLHAGAQDEAALVERARDLLRAAFIRARFLGPLRAGATEMGRRVLILGGSEAGVAAAQNLARQGLEVRLVHRGRLGGPELPAAVAARPLPGDLGPGVAVVEEAEIIEVTGHVGDFSVAANVGGRKRRWQADVLCVTDFHLVPLTIYAGQVGLKKFYRFDFAFFNTPQMGVYRLMPKTLERVSPAEAGAALAAEVATSAAKAFLNDHQLSPWVDPLRCRGCGRCAEICPFDAVTMRPNADGSFRAEVLRYNCVGCGGCVGRCPVTALDMPYFSNRLLEEMVAGVLAGEG
jgi:heterodisulfide reductase subunit A-like polyferredoxin